MSTLCNLHYTFELAEKLNNVVCLLLRSDPIDSPCSLIYMLPGCLKTAFHIISSQLKEGKVKSTTFNCLRNLKEEEKILPMCSLCPTLVDSGRGWLSLRQNSPYVLIMLYTSRLSGVGGCH